MSQLVRILTKMRDEQIIGYGRLMSSGSGYMFIYAGVIPLLFLAIWAVVLQPKSHQVHVTILGFFISLILSSFLTDVVKNAVGRPRPDLIARCKPAKDSPEHSLVTIDICTETNYHILHDGWRSFPSGHSSFAFSGLGYLALSGSPIHPFPHNLYARVFRITLT